ncbi:MAG TPA: hypothetical protein VLX92_26915 [Kofleriaceae bacterium]|nr:hypothetical protein [Kofleriaceae bacterium]
MRRAVLPLVLVACGGPQVAEPKLADLSKQLPATLEADHPHQGDPRPAHVRIYADAAIRALPRWKEDLADQLDYASQLLTPMFGVKLVVDDVKPWDRTGDPKDALKALAAADDGRDVTWVIGYVAPGDVASKAMSELGDAQVLGHYVTVRGWAEKPETDALAPKLPDLKPAERSEVLQAHRRHKQTVVLLHMLAQTLGAIDEADPSWIQHPLYSPKQSTFAGRTRELMQVAIDQRLSGETDATIAHALLEQIEKQDWGGWIPADHDQVVAALRNVADAAKAGKTAADVPTAAYEQFDRVRELRKRGDLASAMTELDNLLVAYPANATMHELKCEILIDKPGIADRTTRQVCNRVAELAPGDPTVHFTVGEALAKAGDIAGAHAELALASGKIANLTIGQDDAWKRLIGIYQTMGALTWTEDAIAAAKLDRDPAAELVAEARARYGVPRGAKFVRPEAEGALVDAVRGALDLVYASKYGEAERAIDAGERKWRGAPGFEAARCDLLLRQGSTDAARGACVRAIAADPQESWALYLAGVIDLRDTSAGGTRAGIASLKKAIAADPTLKQAWHALGKALERAHDATSLDEARKAYQAKFNEPLP